jgi:crossover junction endodeoxyribonuclease RuvC
MIRILGIDPGTARVGWGCIEENFGKITTLKYGCITTEKDTLAEQRLSIIFHSLTKLITALRPDCMSVEDLYFSTNAKTAISVGQARGVILLAASEKNIPIASYSPNAVKKAICGSGSADKTQMGKMITTLLRLKEVPTPDDTADALAIAATHAYSYKLKQNMQISR